MHRNGTLKSIPFYKRTSLFKRYKRYLKKLTENEHPLSKAFALLSLALLLSASGIAQCDSFVNAQASNPLKRLALPFAPNKPSFVDIDNDGDLDCYVVYPDASFNVQFAFLKNNGSKDFPFFALDSTGGLPGTTNIGFDEGVQGMDFVDIDGDGDYDCFIGNYFCCDAGTAEYFKNVGDKTHPIFVQQPKDQNPLGFLSGSYGLYFNLVDIDSDGDYDLFTTDLYYNNFFENTGTVSSPVFVATKSKVFEFFNRFYAHKVFFDWNKDGLTDIIKTNGLIERIGNNRFYKNVGTATAPAFIKDFANGPKFSTDFILYAFADLNNDGYPEAFSSNCTYAVTSPVATITATKQNSSTRLDAYPKGTYSYQWKRNGVNIANATTDFIEVSQPGLYTVEITGDCGTGISLPYRLKSNNEIIASAKENLLSPGSKNISLQLYPNPFTDECVLKFDKGITGKAIIHVTDAQGRLVVSMNVNNSSVHFGKELKPGIYFVQVIQNNNIIFRKKIIKQ